MVKLKKKIESSCLPLWAVHLVDTGRYLIRMARIANRYSLADHSDGLSCQPLFIISSGRAGTTLLRSMLVAGGQIAIPLETHVIRTAVRKFLSLQHLEWRDLSRLIITLFESHRHFHLWETNLYPAYQSVMNLPEHERCLARVIDQVFQCYAAQQFPEATVWGDQSTINTLYLPWIFETFPQAKYLHLLRDGRDAIASMLATGRTNLERATERWVVSVERCLNLQEQLDADQFLEVRYEALVTEPEETLEHVCEFVGIEYNIQMLDFWKLPTTVEKNHHAYHYNLGKPVFSNSIGKWTERLSSAQQQYILSKTYELLQQLEYLE